MPDPREEGLDRRFRRQRRQQSSFRQFLSNRVQLELPDLQEGDPNRVKTRGDPPSALALLFQGVDRWPLHRALHQRVKAADTNLTFSVSVSFYHFPTGSFFGGTWESGTAEAERTGSKGSGSSPFVAYDVTINDVVMWYTYIDDPRTAVVVELVATETDKAHGITVGTYGCGWAVLGPSPFGRRGITSAEAHEEDGVLNRASYSSATILHGTPRALTRLATAAELDKLPSFEGALLRFRIVQHNGLLKVTPLLPAPVNPSPHLHPHRLNSRLVPQSQIGTFKARHLVAENELVGSSDPVPGLARRALPAGRGVTGGGRPGRAAALGCTLAGALSAGGGRDDASERSVDSAAGELAAAVSVARHVRLEPTLDLEVSRAGCRVQDCGTLEASLRRSLDWSLSGDESRLDAMVRLSGAAPALAGPALRDAAARYPLSEPQTIRFKVLERRLRFALHNGRQFTLADLSPRVVRLAERDRTAPESEGNSAPVTELYPVSARGKEDREGRVVLPRLARHKHFALVVFLEYVVRPEQNGLRVPPPPAGVDLADPESPGREDHLTAHARTATVVVGSALHLPWDGRRLRLRGSVDARLMVAGEEKAGRFTLPLAVTEATRLLAAQLPDKPLVWPPPGSEELLDGDRAAALARDKPMRFVHFKCAAREHSTAAGEGRVVKVSAQTHRRSGALTFPGRRTRGMFAASLTGANCRHSPDFKSPRPPSCCAWWYAGVCVCGGGALQDETPSDPADEDADGTWSDDEGVSEGEEKEGDKSSSDDEQDEDAREGSEESKDDRARDRHERAGRRPSSTPRKKRPERDPASPPGSLGTASSASDDHEEVTRRTHLGVRSVLSKGGWGSTCHSHL